MNHFPKTFSRVAQIFTKQSNTKEDHRPAYGVKIILHLNPQKEYCCILTLQVEHLKRDKSLSLRAVNKCQFTLILNKTVNKTGLHCFPVVLFGVSRHLKPF